MQKFPPSPDARLPLAIAQTIRMSNYLKDMPQNRQYTNILVSSQVLTQQYQASAKLVRITIPKCHM